MNTIAKRLMVTASILGAVLGLFVFADPLGWKWFPRCLFHEVTGLNCPGCGMSRAMCALAHGDWLAMIHSNLLLLVALPIGIYWIVRGETSTLKPRWVWGLVSVVLLFGIVRNIPAYPFTLLAP